MSKVISASATWQGNMKFEGHAPSSGFTLPMDAGKVSGGEGTGFSPMELLLVGLAGCTAMDVISILKKKRQDVSGLVVNVKGTRGDTHPKVYEDIEIEYVLTGNGVDPKALERAIGLSESKYCGVQAMLKQTASVRSTYRIEAEQ